MRQATMGLRAASAVAVLAASLPAAAEARTARCEIQAEGESYRGPCDFQSERGGSFSVEHPDGHNLLPGVAMLSLTITSPGVGEVRALTGGGISTSWGEARRSEHDPACWNADGLLTLCAY